MYKPYKYKYLMPILIIFLSLATITIVLLIMKPNIKTEIDISTILLFLSIIFFGYETYLLRRSVTQQSITKIYDRWLEISKMEIEFTDFHKLFMG